MGQGLVQPLPPRRAPHVQPKLNLYRAIDHQEGVGWGHQHRARGLELPALDIGRRDHAPLYHAHVFQAQRYGGVPCAFTICAVWGERISHHLPELSDRLDQVGHHAPSVDLPVKAVPALRQHFGEQPADVLVQLARLPLGICDQPPAQLLVPAAQGVADPLLCACLDPVKGRQRRTPVPRAVDDLGQEAGSHQVQPLYGLHQGLSDIGR